MTIITETKVSFSYDEKEYAEKFERENTGYVKESTSNGWIYIFKSVYKN